MALIPALGRLKQEEFELVISLVCIARPWVKKLTNKTNLRDNGLPGFKRSGCRHSKLLLLPSSQFLELAQTWKSDSWRWQAHGIAY